MEYPKLKAILDEKVLLQEEKDLWLALGIYITTDPYLHSIGCQIGVDLYDACGNFCVIGSVMGKNLRLSLVTWWQKEKAKAKTSLKEIQPDVTGIGDLENRNGS